MSNFLYERPDTEKQSWQKFLPGIANQHEVLTDAELKQIGLMPPSNIQITDKYHNNKPLSTYTDIMEGSLSHESYHPISTQRSDHLSEPHLEPELKPEPEPEPLLLSRREQYMAQVQRHSSKLNHEPEQYTQQQLHSIHTRQSLPSVDEAFVDSQSHNTWVDRQQMKITQQQQQQKHQQEQQKQQQQRQHHRLPLAIPDDASVASSNGDSSNNLNRKDLKVIDDVVGKVIEEVFASGDVKMKHTKEYKYWDRRVRVMVMKRLRHQIKQSFASNGLDVPDDETFDKMVSDLNNDQLKEQEIKHHQTMYQVEYKEIEWLATGALPFISSIVEEFIVKAMKLKDFEGFTELIQTEVDIGRFAPVVRHLCNSHFMNKLKNPVYYGSFIFIMLAVKHYAKKQFTLGGANSNDLEQQKKEMDEMKQQLAFYQDKMQASQNKLTRMLEKERKKSDKHAKQVIQIMNAFKKYKSNTKKKLQRAKRKYNNKRKRKKAKKNKKNNKEKEEEQESNVSSSSSESSGSSSMSDSFSELSVDNDNDDDDDNDEYEDTTDDSEEYDKIHKPFSVHKSELRQKKQQEAEKRKRIQLEEDKKRQERQKRRKQNQLRLLEEKKKALANAKDSQVSESDEPLHDPNARKPNVKLEETDDYQDPLQIIQKPLATMTTSISQAIQIREEKNNLQKIDHAIC